MVALASTEILHPVIPTHILAQMTLNRTTTKAMNHKVHAVSPLHLHPNPVIL
jgi:hypothetical protein